MPLPKILSFANTVQRGFVYLKLRLLYIYLGTALLAQLAFYRAVSIELGNDQLGIFAQVIGIAMIAAAFIRFGCEAALARVIVTSNAPVEEHRAIAVRYVTAALTRSLAYTAPIYLAAYVLLDATLVLIALSTLFAFNLSFSFIERAMGNHLSMVMLDSRASMAALTITYYLFGFISASADAIIALIALIEGGKFVVYMFSVSRFVSLSGFTGKDTTFRFRFSYAANSFLSIVSTYGLQIFLPIFIGVSGAGAFFLLQRIANPLTFILNVSNSVTTAKILRDESNVRRIYYHSLKELTLVAAGLSLAAVILHSPLLEFFELSEYSFEFALILGGVVMNLLTGASAPVFNTLGRPALNALTSLSFIIIFFIISGLLYKVAVLDLRGIAWIFFFASVIKNIFVVFGLRKVEKLGLF